MIDRIASLLRMRRPDIGVGYLFDSGSTVPADATREYRTGAIFQHTDGGAETALYVNEGTASSSAFVPLLTASVELADLADIGTLAYTSGWMLVADGDSYEETDDIYLPKTGTFRLGDWVAGGETTGGAPLTNDRDTYGDGQIDILQVHGVSTTSVGSDHSAKCGRFRHLVNMSGTIETETYGLVGQLVVKTATIGHSHAGLMGILEVLTAATANTSYKFSVAGIIARLELGSAITTATTPICGFVAVSNNSALVSGDLVAYGLCSTGANNWKYAIGVADCDNFAFFDSGTDYEDGCKLATVTPGANGDGVIRIVVNDTAYYIPFYAAGSISGE